MAYFDFAAARTKIQTRMDNVKENRAALIKCIRLYYTLTKSSMNAAMEEKLAGMTNEEISEILKSLVMDTLNRDMIDGTRHANEIYKAMISC